MIHDNFKPRLLIADADAESLARLRSILETDYEIAEAGSGKDALDKAVTLGPDLILIDVVMDDLSGFDVLLKLKESHVTMGIPLIFISSMCDPECEEKGLLLGAADFIKKPYYDIIVKARVATQIQNAAQKKEIERLSMIDALTGIPNRRSFDIRLELEWAHAIRGRLPISLLMLDIDFFKAYNDTYGHPQGDTLLKNFARVVSKSIKRAADVCARIGGEEFAVLLPGTSLEGAVQTAENIRLSVEAMTTLTAKSEETKVTVSIGIANMHPIYGDNLKTLIDEADARLYVSKRTGRNKVSYDT